MTLPTAEAVARAFCRRRGIDPNDDGNDEGWPNWWFYLAAAEVQLARRREQAEWDAAIEEARS